MVLCFVALLLIRMVTGSCESGFIGADTLTFLENNDSQSPYTISLNWNLVNNNSIDLYVSVISTTVKPNWLSVGISEVGSMSGSDVAVFFSNGSVVDMFVPWEAYPLKSPMPTPQRDSDHQDWTVSCSFFNGSTLTAVLRRQLDTADQQDRAIRSTDGAIPVIYAWGVSSALSYHGANRGSKKINFFNKVPPIFTAPIGAVKTNLNFAPAWKTQKIQQQYICQIIDTGLDARHIVAIEPVSNPYIHHVLLHACGNDLSLLTNQNLKLDYPSPCLSSSPTAHGNSPLGRSGCTMIYGSALGGGPLVLPDQAGILLSPSANRYIVLETHLDNPTLAANISIADIVYMYTTTTLRPNNAGVMIIGDPSVDFADIPPGVAMHHVESSCTPACTQNIKNGGVTVFNSFLHQHSTGRQVWSNKVTFSGNVLTSKVIIDYRAYWSFEHQSQTLVNFTLQRGDQINTHCVYDTSKYATAVPFGSDSTMEMCMHFLFYYPVENGLQFCGVRSKNSFCGTGLPIFEANPIADGDTALPAYLLLDKTAISQSDKSLFTVGSPAFYILVGSIAGVAMLGIILVVTRVVTKKIRVVLPSEAHPSYFDPT